MSLFPRSQQRSRRDVSIVPLSVANPVSPIAPTTGRGAEAAYCTRSRVSSYSLETSTTPRCHSLQSHALPFPAQSCVIIQSAVVSIHVTNTGCPTQYLSSSRSLLPVCPYLSDSHPSVLCLRAPINSTTYQDACRSTHQACFDPLEWFVFATLIEDFADLGR